jgi:hypothetical protein
MTATPKKQPGTSSSNSMRGYMSKDLLQLVGFSNGMATIPCLLSLMCVLLERAEFEFEFERSEPFSTATMKRSSYVC